MPTIEGKGIITRFTDHPADVGETYREHQQVALHFSRHLLKASLQAAVHAVLPWCFRTSASDTIARLHDEMTSGRRNRSATEAPPSTPEIPIAV
ncbi:MAG: DUF6356 family protein [Actinomycetota bacterium]